jgi:site-specific DNA-methyltransferase (adenine-specific)
VSVAEQHVLHLGDCLEGMKALGDKGVDHVICDPPYEAEAHTRGRRIKTVGGGGNYGQTGSCVLNFAPITEAERKQAAREMARVARRWILVFCQVEAVAAWRDALTAECADAECACDGGAIYKRTCAWLKSDAQPQMTGDRPGMGYESIVCAHAPGRSRWNGGGKRGVYESARASTIERRPALHMTEKPLPLMEALVSDFTDPGELVLDPFAGSGTTGVACKRLGRNFIGWEKDPTFHAAAVKRIEAARQQGEFFARGPKPKQGRLLP